jgi:hypothetical protein
MRRADFHRHVGDENICASVTDALARAESLYRAGRPAEPAA